MAQAPLTINQYLLARNTLVVTAFPQGISALICDYFQINDVRDLLYCQGRRVNKKLKHHPMTDIATCQSYVLSIDPWGARCGKYPHIYLSRGVPGESCSVRARCALDDPYCDAMMAMRECDDELTTKWGNETIQVCAPGQEAALVNVP